jgi:hypothetical protein
MRIRIHNLGNKEKKRCWGSALVSMQIWIRIQDFDNQKLGKITAKKFSYFFIVFGSKIAIYLYLGLH